jgi:hypothetical protein
LIEACASAPNNHLPSWCPDWSSPPTHWTHLQRTFYNVGGKIQKWSIDVAGNANEIGVQGYRVDVINRVPDLIARRPVSMYDTWLKIARETYQCKDEVPEVFWRTLVGEVINPDYPSSTFDSRYYETWRRCIDDLVMSKVEGLTEEDIQLTQAYDRMMNYFGYPRKLITSSGGRIGMVKGDVGVGDALCVIRGLGPIFVLRFNNHGQARLIAEGYIHGLMTDEEALNCSTRESDEKIVLI